ncbi:MAG: hypothetical protein HY047_03095 [Acidobacteria bacterium]|nr:hypothetical protein [Acidobacteriota bacterium]
MPNRAEIAPTILSVERSILRFLKNSPQPVSPSELFVQKTLDGNSTADERRKALWNLVDRGKVKILADLKLRAG